jgi:F-type H+-transporting ATPase subunit b
MVFIQIIIVQILAFLALVFVLRKVMLSSSYSETNRMKKLNEENTQKAQELAKKVSDAERQYQEKVIFAEETIKKMKNEAKEETDLTVKKMLSEARTQSEHLIQQASNAREEIRDEMAEGMRDKSLALACQIFERVMDKRQLKIVHEGYVDEILDEIDKMSETALGKQDGEASIEVKTPFPLSSLHHKRLEYVLGSKVREGLRVQEVKDPSVVAGVIIKLGNLVVDGSLSGKAKRVAKTLKEG